MGVLFESCLNLESEAETLLSSFMDSDLGLPDSSYLFGVAKLALASNLNEAHSKKVN